MNLNKISLSYHIACINHTFYANALDSYMEFRYEEKRGFEAGGLYPSQSRERRSTDLRDGQDGSGNNRSLDEVRACDFIEGKTEWHNRCVASAPRALLAGNHLLGRVHDFKADFNP